MTLSALIQKRDTGNLATAIPAISATQPKGDAATVARIATVAVANPKEEKTASPAKVGAGDTATASRWWLIHYPDRDPVEVACCPEATHADILERHPDAVAAEPFTPTIRQPSAPLTASEEAVIRAWLALIEETDPATIAEVIGQCQRDAGARGYFTGRAAADNLQKNRADAAFDDDRRRRDVFVIAVVAGWHFGDLVYDIHARGDLAEHRIAVAARIGGGFMVEGGVVFQVDEELDAC